MIEAFADLFDLRGLVANCGLGSSYVFTILSTATVATEHGSEEGDRTLATDKVLFPRGGLVFVETKAKNRSKPDQWFHQFMLDQDTGGAIRTAGRADIYLGVGPEAERRAGRTMAEGQLYYLFLNAHDFQTPTP